MSDSSSQLQAVHVFHYLLSWMSCGVLRGFRGWAAAPIRQQNLFTLHPCCRWNGLSWRETLRPWPFYSAVGWSMRQPGHFQWAGTGMCRPLTGFCQRLH